MKNNSRTKKLFLILLFGAFVAPLLTNASTTSGTIDSANKYAKGLDADIGRINFGATNGNVIVTDSAITGYAWSEVFGWINLSPTNGGITNNGEGTLSGYAWGENTGWINFKPTNGGVTINSGGDFLGYAWGENIGWILFNCATNNSCATENFKVSTDWRPRSARPACNNATDDDGDGKTDYPTDAGCASLSDTDEAGPFGGGWSAPQQSLITNQPTTANSQTTQDSSNGNVPQNNTEIVSIIKNQKPKDDVTTGVLHENKNSEDIQSTTGGEKGNNFTKSVRTFINNGVNSVTENVNSIVKGIKKIATYTGTMVSKFYSLVIKTTETTFTRIWHIIKWYTNKIML